MIIKISPNTTGIHHLLAKTTVVEITSLPHAPPIPTTVRTASDSPSGVQDNVDSNDSLDNTLPSHTHIASASHDSVKNIDALNCTPSFHPGNEAPHSMILLVTIIY